MSKIILSSHIFIYKIKDTIKELEYISSIVRLTFIERQKYDGGQIKGLFLLFEESIYRNK